MVKKVKVEEPDEFKLALENYKLELKLVYEKSQDAFQKQLSYLSAGALGFSILYIQNVVKDFDDCDYKWLLTISWVLLTLPL